MRVLGGLYLAVVILLFSIGAGLYVDIKSEQTHDQNREILVGLERMVRLNQALTHLITTAVIEKNSLRAAGYPSVLAELDATMQDVQALSTRMMLSGEIRALREEQSVLRAQESETLALMRQDQWPEARRILFGDDYVLAKKLYEINSETAIGALTGELATTRAYFARLRFMAQGTRIAALLLLLWVGVVFSRRLRAEASEQARLRDAVAASNRELEEKVLLRTAELETANQQLQALSATDGLTGLANRRAFDQQWAEEWQRASRQGVPLAVAMLDVDQFKLYNDHYGHQAGDVCLRILAQTMANTVQRSGELVARYGGEEFVIILPGLGGAEALAAMERIRAAVQGLGLPHAKATVAGVVTISIGVASCVPQHGQDAASLVQAADAALYQAKHQGRNKVVLAG